MLPLGKLLTAVAVVASTTFLHNGDVSLPAKIMAPVGFSGPRPAVVLIQGAGPRDVDAYLPEAEAFARAGIVALIYQKRTAGYTPVSRSYADLAADALAGVQLLRSRPDVDPSRIGLWGYSEGGWVAPLADNGRRPSLRRRALAPPAPWPPSTRPRPHRGCLPPVGSLVGTAHSVIR